MHDDIKICAVIVTYNRIEKLKKTIHSFENQISVPDKIYIVDNHSNDETPFFLKKWRSGCTKFEVEIINLKKNIGGSGGFCKGISKAVKDGFDWIWASDDDAYLDAYAFQMVRLNIEKFKGEDISAICGTVYYQGGIDYSHRRTLNEAGLKIRDVPSNENDYKKNYFEINAFSYVGSIINSRALKKVGVTLKDYFIWCDDTEHSLRLSKIGKILCIPEIKVFHDVEKSNDYKLTWKEYYGERNQLDMYRRHFSRKVYFYYLVRSKLRIIKKFLSGKVEEAKLLNCAINDCQHDKFGIHPIYKPGWKPDGK